MYDYKSSYATIQCPKCNFKKECLRYIDIWGYTDSHENLLYPQIKVALGESEEK